MGSLTQRLACQKLQNAASQAAADDGSGNVGFESNSVISQGQICVGPEDDEEINNMAEELSYALSAVSVFFKPAKAVLINQHESLGMISWMCTCNNSCMLKFMNHFD